MSNLNDRIELEQQFILRVPTKLADQLNFSSELELEFAQGQKEFSLKIQDDSGSKTVKGSIHRLPCLVESHKSFDTCNFYKSGDIGQILVVHDDSIDAPPVPTELQDVLASGLTIPTNNIVKRRWRKPVEDHFYSNQEKEILKSIRGGADQLEIEIVKASDYVGVQDSREEITQPIPKAWRYVKRDVAIQHLNNHPPTTADDIEHEFRSQFKSIVPPKSQPLTHKKSTDANQTVTIRIPSKQTLKKSPLPLQSSTATTTAGGVQNPKTPTPPQQAKAATPKQNIKLTPPQKSGQTTFIHSSLKTTPPPSTSRPSQPKVSGQQRNIMDIILSKPCSSNNSIPKLPSKTAPTKEVQEMTALLQTKRQKIYNIINYAEKLKLSKEIKELEVRLQSLTTQ